MKICLAENIYKLRKSHNMNQEQLAEALDVSIGAVSKWERGQATPELGHIVKMAEIFEVAVDALIGYKVQNNACREYEERISNLQKAKKYEEASEEADKALARYPNDFKLVYRCGMMYQCKGSETGEKKSLEKAIELLGRAIALLSQNDNYEISELTISAEIAGCYVALGQTEKGIELLKKCNVGGVLNATIGMFYMESDKYDADEALPYLTKGFLYCMQSLFRVMDGYKKYYISKKDYKAAMETAVWFGQYLNSIKKPGKISVIDKYLAVTYIECALMSETLQRKNDVTKYVKKALQAAKAFDQNPTYRVTEIRFCLGDVQNAVFYDDLGKSAIDSVERAIQEYQENDYTEKVWQELIKENEDETLE